VQPAEACLWLADLIVDAKLDGRSDPDVRPGTSRSIAHIGASSSAFCPASKTASLVGDGVKPAHPDVDALWSMVSEIRASLPAPSEHRRLLPFLEYLLSSLGAQIHGPELAPTAGVPTLPLLNSQPPRRLFKSISDQNATATESKISVSTTAVLRFITQ
jgi:hypothetical protein